MLFLVLTLAAAPAPPPSVDAAPSGEEGAGRHGPVVDEGPPPAWQYFAVPAGLSLTSSVLLSPIIVLLPIATTTTVVALTVGPPAVAVVGAARVDDEFAVSVGIVVGDVVGVVAGGVAGFVAWSSFASELGDSFYSRFAIAAAFTYGGAALTRAVGSGVGGVVGHLVSPSASED